MVYMISYQECVPKHKHTDMDEPVLLKKYYTSFEEAGKGIEKDVYRQIDLYRAKCRVNPASVVTDLTEDEGFSLLKVWVPDSPGWRERWYKYYVEELPCGDSD